MTGVFLTQYQGWFLGPIARLLGFIINGIYWFMDTVFNVQNIGLIIILFTIVIYIILIPLTYRQQKFSTLTRKMQPELAAVQKKYKGKKDQASMVAQQAEMKEVYERYGISQTGSCVQLIIQMPLLLALWRVINNIPAYVTGLRNLYEPVVTGIMGTPDYQQNMTNLVEEISMTAPPAVFHGGDAAAATVPEMANFVIDVLYKLPSTAWETLISHFPALDVGIQNLQETMSHLNYFLGLNIADSPWNIIQDAWRTGAYGLVIGAAMIPILSGASQFLNTKLMPTPQTGDNENGTMTSTMKTMNYMMPLMSVFFAVTLPVGMGIYWIAGALVRSIQQFLFNRHFEKEDLEELIRKNVEKSKKKRKKKGFLENQIANAAQINAKKLSDKAGYKNDKDSVADAPNLNKGTKINGTPVSSSSSAPAGSMRAKANLVREFNEKNNK